MTITKDTFKALRTKLQPILKRNTNTVEYESIMILFSQLDQYIDEDQKELELLRKVSEL